MLIVKANYMISGDETEREKGRKALQKLYKSSLEAEDCFVIRPAGIDASVIRYGAKQFAPEGLQLMKMPHYEKRKAGWIEYVKKLFLY